MKAEFNNPGNLADEVVDQMRRRQIDSKTIVCWNTGVCLA
jgi:hypothetical protein